MKNDESKRELVWTVMMYMPMKDGETEEEASSRMYDLVDKSGLEFNVYEEEAREI